ncbi:MAG: tRNA (adenosine(37)-N6)-threonylcarbamoyltransferase complex dimerization subunit type 1 TsaB [Alphaproteobacteria bacterium]
MQDKYILAIDCATGPCSAAVWKNGAIAGYAEDLRPTIQSSRLVPLIEDVLRQAQLTYKDLTAVACTTGPGSFTGIRIGLATARGIAYAAGIHGLGFTTLDVVAYGLKDTHKNIFAVLNAGKGEWYFQGFSVEPYWNAIDTAQVASPEKAANAAQANAQWVGNIDGENIIKAFPRADNLAALAAASTSATPLSPFYIRPPDITMPKVKDKSML